MSLVDLHMHSTFSDGFFTPSQLVQASVAASLSVIALTDHDSVNGVAEALKAAQLVSGPLQVIPGVELGTQADNHSIHILGYGLDITYELLLTAIRSLRQAREVRLQKILALLKALNLTVSVLPPDAKNRAVGRPHVAKAMVAQGYVKTVQEAFDKYLGRGRPAYVPQPKLAPREAVALIHQSGGLAFMAHPEETGDRSLVQNLIEALPWDGLEVYHPSALQAGTTEYWRNIALGHKLLLSGGSDFHGISGRYPEHVGEFVVESNKISLPDLLQKPNHMLQ
jgi:predicted metal-dependent phosphoesterase TrpH